MIHVGHITMVMRFIDVCQYCWVSSQCTGAIELSVFSEHFSTELDVVDIHDRENRQLRHSNLEGTGMFKQFISPIPPCSQVKTISIELSSSVSVNTVRVEFVTISYIVCNFSF